MTFYSLNCEGGGDAGHSGTGVALLVQGPWLFAFGPGWNDDLHALLLDAEFENPGK